jgi:hypothetical protein
MNTQSMKAASSAVAVYAEASAESHELQEALEAAWREQLSDPVAANAIANILRTTPDKLPLDRPPLRIEPADSGLTASEIVVLISSWVATDIVLKALTDLGKDVVKDAIRKVWNKYLEPAVMNRMRKRDALGQRREEEDG